jgi:hypothetical protein
VRLFFLGFGFCVCVAGFVLRRGGVWCYDTLVFQFGNGVLLVLVRYHGTCYAV